MKKQNIFIELLSSFLGYEAINILYYLLYELTNNHLFSRAAEYTVVLFIFSSALELIILFSVCKWMLSIILKNNSKLVLKNIGLLLTIDSVLRLCNINPRISSGYIVGILFLFLLGVYMFFAYSENTEAKKADSILEERE